jgi:hypothetical protein
MKRINKCRTLAEFDSSILNLTQSGQSQQAQDSTAQATVNKTDTPTTNSKDTKKNKSDSKTKPEQSAQTAEENKTSTTDQGGAKDYLFFKPDEFIITTYKMPTGWWYGYKDSADPTSKDLKLGFFPSNYVQVIEEFPEEGNKHEPQLI